MKKGSKKTILLSEDCVEIVQRVQEEKKMNHFIDSLEFIIREYLSLSSQGLANQIVEKLDGHYKNTFTRIRLAANAADRNSQIMLEILNTILLTYSDTIDMYRPMQTIESPVMQEAQKEVKRKIAYYKQLKDSKRKEL